MMKLMIVDDEPMIRKGIRTSIDWAYYGVEICGEAKNGKEGLQKALTYGPDIMLVDIRMPMMDGLELAEALKKDLPRAKVVILSGYDDFAYAQKALRIGISEYLLKPVGANKLIQLVLKLKEQIGDERKETEEALHFEQLWNENLSLMQRNFMNTLLRGEVSVHSSVMAKADRLNVLLSGPEYQVVVIDVDDLALIAGNDDSKEREWILFSVKNIAEEVLASVFPCVVYTGDFGGLVVFLNIHPNNRKQLMPCMKKVQTCIKQYVKLSTTIGMGEACKALKETPHSYQEAMSALREKVYCGKGTLIPYRESNHNKGKSMAFVPTEDEKEMLYHLKTMNTKRLDAKLDQVFQEVELSRIPYRQVQTLCVKWLFQSMNQLEQIGVSIPQDMSVLKQPYTEIEKYETLTDLRDWMSQRFRFMISLMEDYKKSGYKHVIAVAMQYVHEHYSENIRLEDVANSAFVTPNYFSRVFKEETGEHFTLWLNKFRIEKAKTFLADISLKIYEVSDCVGYNDYKYFTQMFKKYTGKTPKQYRERHTIAHTQ